MDRLPPQLRAHAEKGKALKIIQKVIKEKNSKMVPRRSARYIKLEELLDESLYSPTQTDRIAIIGSGPAGLHMAYLLDEMNFENVTILEKNNRIAGKSLTKYEYERFVPQEFGTCYTIPYKYAELRRIAEKIGYGSFEEVPVPERYIFKDYGDRDPTTQNQWLISEKIKKWPFKNLPTILAEPLAMLAIGKDLLRYNWNYHSLFKKDIKTIIADTKMTFAEFLKSNGFEDLSPLFSLANTVQGYGYIEELPALYGLWWNSPDEVNGFLASAVHIQEQPACILRHGFERFWEFLYQNRKFQLQKNIEIKKIERGDVVKITDSNNTIQEFDFVIITSNLKDCLNFLDADPVEREILSALRVRSNLTTSLVSVQHTSDPVPLSSWTSSLDPKNKSRLMTIRNSYKIFFPDDNVGKTTDDYLISYQYEPEASPDSEEHQEFLRQNLVRDLTTAGYRDVKVHEQHIWPYFQHWDQEGLNELYPVKLMKKQGYNRTWFAGASSLFESVHDCMEYNIALTSHIRARIGSK